MSAAYYRIAAVIKRSSEDKFLLVRQASPPAPEEDHHRPYLDSHLWDLPSAPLNFLEEGDRVSDLIIQQGDSLHEKFDFGKFDIDSALGQVASQIGRVPAICGSWSVLKYVEEPDFGPDSPVKTLFILGHLLQEDEEFPDSCMWASKDSVANMHLDSRPSGGRIGLFTIIGLLHGSDGFRNWQLPHILLSQEYPLGIIVIPMRSRTQKPFYSTNLVIILTDGEASESEDPAIFKYGDALLVDPGCSTHCHYELEDLVMALPKKLIVFLTHHHYDHIDGLSVINKCNPDAILLAHENTLNRIGKGTWSHQLLVISGGEKINIGNNKLEAVFAPGHTDGHIALLHLNTNALIVGDHCVGAFGFSYGSAVLDITSGGNMKDYFQTTYKFLELSPSVLIPMHGRINLWPRQMLCRYLKHRRDREQEILKAIKNGAETLYDIVANVYANVDIKLWFAASSNVRLHVEHLAYQDVLPKDFSLLDFNRSYDSFIKKISTPSNEK
ncbi:hypothetical protein KSP39_PZI007555 [Platanthera zijinensis]|uniref:Metallo-beta-lactamase domain-containing protein n=1 Tax=Platanthera zijinensis TaxID=2320716 RepID=A0AAP0BN80_9ASPA